MTRMLKAAMGMGWSHDDPPGIGIIHDKADGGVLESFDEAMDGWMYDDGPMCAVNGGGG